MGRCFKLLGLLLCTLGSAVYGQEDNKEVGTQKVWRINIVNPGVELEWPMYRRSTISVGMGIGYSGTYPNLTLRSNPGWLYVIAPFLDIEKKWFYNLDKRVNKGKRIKNNAGDFLSVRLLTRGPALVENVVRSTYVDFALHPTWGIQRLWGKRVHFLMEFGPLAYIDTKGTYGFFPLMAQFNLGYMLN